MPKSTNSPDTSTRELNTTERTLIDKCLGLGFAWSSIRDEAGVDDEWLKNNYYDGKSSHAEKRQKVLRAVDKLIKSRERPTRNWADKALRRGFRADGEWANSVDAYYWLRSIAKRSRTERAIIVHYSGGWAKALLMELMNNETHVTMYVCHPLRAAGFGQRLRTLEFLENLYPELRLDADCGQAKLDVYGHDGQVTTDRLCMLDDDLVAIGKYRKILIDTDPGHHRIRKGEWRISAHTEKCNVYVSGDDKFKQKRQYALDQVKRVEESKPELLVRFQNGRFDVYPHELLDRISKELESAYSEIGRTPRPAKP